MQFIIHNELHFPVTEAGDLTPFRSISLPLKPLLLPANIGQAPGCQTKIICCRTSSRSNSHTHRLSRCPATPDYQDTI